VRAYEAQQFPADIARGAKDGRSNHPRPIHDIA